MKSTSTYTTMMRVTPEGRPFANDLHDIFAAMIFQIKIGDHRSLFRTYPASFTTDNMIEVLDHLQFTHVLRQPDPHDPHKQLETKTITTFSMTRTMAKQLGQHFLTARLIENASDPAGTRTMKDRSIWTVTSKGKWMVYSFAERGHVSWSEQSHTSTALKVVPDRKVMLLDRRDFVHPSSLSHEKINSSNNILNNSSSSSSSNRSIGGNKNDMDAISFERPNMTEAFKSMMEHLETSQLLADDVGGIGTQQMVTYTHTFFGYHVVEYIMQYMSVVNRNEADMVASEFVLYGWISQVLDKSDRANNIKSDLQFKSQRNVIYALTDRGRKALGWEQNQSSNLAPPPPPAMSCSSSNSNASSNRKHKSQQALISDSASTMSSSSIASFASSASSSSNSSSAPLHQQPQLQQKKSDSMYQRQPMTVTTNSLWLDPASGATNDTTPTVSPTVVTRGSSVLMPLTRTFTSTSHYTRLQPILEDPLLRMYFREFLKHNFCEENLHFWVDYRNMLYHHQQQQKTNNNTSTNASGDSTTTVSTATPTSTSANTDYNRILSECYAMYVTYLAPQATMELNIDHTLHQDIIRFVAESFKVMNSHSSHPSSGSSSTSSSSTAANHHLTTTTSSAGTHLAEKRPQQPLPFFYTPTHPSQEQQTIIMVTGHRSQCLKTLLTMYERVHDQICRIMAEDSLPRFLKSPRYVQWQQRQHERQQQELELQHQLNQEEDTYPLSPTPNSKAAAEEEADDLSPSPAITTSTSSNNKIKSQDDTIAPTTRKKKSVSGPSCEKDNDDDDENTDALHKELDRLTLTGVATTATTTTTTTPMTRPQSKPL